MWFKAYASRYGKDLVVFLGAYLLCSIAVLPTVLLGFGMYAVIVYLYMWFFGLINIAIFSVMTALFQSFALKAAAFLLAIAANAYVFWGVLTLDPSERAPGAVNVTALLLYQVPFLFGLFYLLLDRPWTRRPAYE